MTFSTNKVGKSQRTQARLSVFHCIFCWLQSVKYISMTHVHALIESSIASTLNNIFQQCCRLGQGNIKLSYDTLAWLSLEFVNRCCAEQAASSRTARSLLSGAKYARDKLSTNTNQPIKSLSFIVRRLTMTEQVDASQIPCPAVGSELSKNKKWMCSKLMCVCWEVSEMREYSACKTSGELWSELCQKTRKIL